jgi:hypothetical protein
VARPEDLKPNCAIRGVLPGGLVTVVSVAWFGSDAIELNYKNAAGRVGNELLYRDREADLEIVETGYPLVTDVVSETRKARAEEKPAVTEGLRLRDGHARDPAYVGLRHLTEAEIPT